MIYNDNADDGIMMKKAGIIYENDIMITIPSGYINELLDNTIMQHNVFNVITLINYNYYNNI